MSEKYQALLDQTIKDRDAHSTRVSRLLDEKDELKARLNRINAMYEVSLLDKEKMKKDIAALEAGTRQLKSISQGFCNIDKKLLTELALDMAQGVYTGHFETTSERLMMLRKVAGLSA